MHIRSAMLLLVACASVAFTAPCMLVKSISIWQKNSRVPLLIGIVDGLKQRDDLTSTINQDTNFRQTLHARMLPHKTDPKPGSAAEPRRNTRPSRVFNDPPRAEEVQVSKHMAKITNDINENRRTEEAAADAAIKTAVAKKPGWIDSFAKQEEALSAKNPNWLVDYMFRHPEQEGQVRKIAAALS
jgi:hypothetical protein